tara:strand:+ start:136 stop:267 length:132 start_codon:yes stop_codon:yes gene_type:complete
MVRVYPSFPPKVEHLTLTKYGLIMNKDKLQVELLDRVQTSIEK